MLTRFGSFFAASPSCRLSFGYRTERRMSTTRACLLGMAVAIGKGRVAITDSDADRVAVGSLVPVMSDEFLQPS